MLISAAATIICASSYCPAYSIFDRSFPSALSARFTSQNDNADTLANNTSTDVNESTNNKNEWIIAIIVRERMVHSRLKPEPRVGWLW
jgi:hypothetical protein